MEAIRLEHLTTGYADKPVARDITAELKGGELTALIGANGVGKSTLLRTLAGFQPKLSGRIKIADKDMETYNTKALARLVSIVLTANDDIRNLNAEEVVSLGRSPYTGFLGTLDSDDRRIVDEALRVTGTEHLRRRMIDTLSDGERQKIIIAKALAQQTPIILLDEPTAFLDFPSKVAMTQLLRRLAHDLGKIVLLSTHDLGIALQLSDTIWLATDDGSIVTGSPHELADSGILQDKLCKNGIDIDPLSLSIRIDAANIGTHP